jgi:hypothetical protein
MQPIMETTLEDIASGPLKPRSPRRLVMSSTSYPSAVVCCVLSVATVGLVAACVCTQFFQEYTALLQNLGTG